MRPRLGKEAEPRALGAGGPLAGCWWSSAPCSSCAAWLLCASAAAWVASRMGKMRAGRLTKWPSSLLIMIALCRAPSPVSTRTVDTGREPGLNTRSGWCKGRRTPGWIVKEAITQRRFKKPGDAVTCAVSNTVFANMVLVWWESGGREEMLEMMLETFCEKNDPIHK